MTFTKDSPLVGLVKPTPSSEMGSRPGGLADIKGIFIHMAEGGGTASWLTRPDGNSSHYVVEYTGRIVQMVPEKYWAGSINPRLLRTNNDPAFEFGGSTVIYGRTAAVRVMGLTAANNPNRYGIAIEVEGFARVGPNAKQRAALKKLVNDIRRRRGSLGALGHRDFQSYKMCPGHKIPWGDYGGHGIKRTYVADLNPPPTIPEATVIPQFLVPEVPTRVILEEDPDRPGNSKWIYATSKCVKDGKEISLAPIRSLSLVGFASPDVYIVAYEGSSQDTDATSKVYFVPVTDIAKTEAIVITDAAAVAAPLNARIAAIKSKAAAFAADLAND